jgi:hypothetical protein
MAYDTNELSLDGAFSDEKQIVPTYRSAENSQHPRIPL